MKPKTRTLLAIALTTVGLGAVLEAAYVAFVRPGFEEQKRVRQLEIRDVDLGRIADGNYEGSFSYGGFTHVVEVTVQNRRIENIRILQNRKTVHALEAEGVITRVLQAQSPRVDVVTGATTTSKALLKAIENALTRHE